MHTEVDAGSIADKASLKDETLPVDLKDVSSATHGQANEYSDEQFKRLTRKIDWYLMPIMCFMYGIQQTDKTSISLQAVFSMPSQMGMVGQQYQWLTTIFYLTYLIGEFPSTWLLQKYKIGRVLSIYIVGWSICLICISACNTWSQVMALRALQGFFECNISPGFLLITGSFYKTKEHASRSLYWQSSQGLFSIICNLILWAIAKHLAVVGGIDAWRTISLFLGGLTLVGAVFSFLLLGSPDEVRWLSPEEKKMANLRVLDNKIGEESTSRKWNWEHVHECYKDPQVWFQFINTFLACVPNGSFTTFSSILFVTFGFDSYESMIYGIPRNGLYVVALIATAWYVERVQNHRIFVMILSCLIPMVGMLVMSLLPDEPQYKWTKFAMFTITPIFSLALFLGWSFITSNVAGTTKRTVVSSVTLVGYCVGNMVGSQVFQTSDAPRYIRGTIACTVCFALEIVLCIGWYIYYWRENKRRDRVAAEAGISAEEQDRQGAILGEQDVTDLKNPHFRYTL